MNIVDNHEPGILVAHAVDAVLKAFRVRRRPPVLQVALGVELPSLVIERVRQLMSDRRARVPIIRSVIQLYVVQRCLQHSSRKVDVVHLRVEVGIHRRWCHPPLVQVDRLPQLVPFARVFKT